MGTEPEEPPPIRIQEQPAEQSDAQQEAEAEREWELYEIREKTKALRALFSNRAFVDPDGKHLRISFGERVGDEDVYHTSVVIPLEEAYQLGDLLLRMSTAGLGQMWEQIRLTLASEKAAPESPNG